jgi:hypothetical protein
MYNIHSHYENIFSFIKSLGINIRLMHLHPFGSTKIDNVELLQDKPNIDYLILCFDQEPLMLYYNRSLFEHAREVANFMTRPYYKDAMFGYDSNMFNTNITIGSEKLMISYDSNIFNTNITISSEKLNKNIFPNVPIILINTEKHSQEKNNILKEFDFIDCNYFFHAFAAADWYRGYRYSAELIDPSKRIIKKKYITFNRLTGSARAYRSFLVAELAKHNLLDQGYVSYSNVCPEHGHYEHNILATVGERNVSADYVIRARYALDRIDYPLRIDNTDAIPNGSQTLGPIPELMTSFLHVVTETCYWDEKTHLTEKIFKPIVARQPFVLLGCANNLKYLRSYGFKTFDAWWDESYDSIEDPIERLQAVVKIINDICAMSNEELTAMLRAMQHVLDYNYNRFYSKEFIDYCWNELTENLQQILVQPSLLTALRT